MKNLQTHFRLLWHREVWSLNPCDSCFQEGLEETWFARARDLDSSRDRRLPNFPAASLKRFALLL